MAEVKDATVALMSALPSVLKSPPIKAYLIFES